MKQLKSIIKRIIFTVILCSFIISSCVMPASYAKLDLGDGDFYYAGTTKGSYVPQEGIFSWLINLLGELVDWLLGIITMGFRMVIVGYTALAEHWLTNALETASGVKANGDEVSTTDISTLSDSSNSVTVQGIVYNMIPALDVNFFKEENKIPYLKEVNFIVGIEEDEEYEKTFGETGVKRAKKSKDPVLAVVSPTGLVLKCSKCGKPVRDCCKALNSEEEKRGVDVNIPDNPCGSSGEDKCECGGNCNACKQYAALVQAKDPPVVILKTLIGVWYTIIRILAAAAMLLLLIFVGIKMATSTIASEKAQYKRMFVDWVVGVILVLGIHYIMIAAVNINEILVDVVKDSASSINEIQLKELASDKKSVLKTDQEIEINVYDEIKTRAYDAKMTVGFSGMIMYATLVFFSLKYTVIYLKRYLTLAVLTLMGPAVGVAYALQKVLTGKSQSFKLWLSEYILNLIIQVVHALIYSVFISAALALSLKNVAGIIIALILMNFSLKAEKLFRKIFNLDAKGGGLLSATEEAGDINKMEQKIKTLQGMALGSKPVAKALTALPTKAVKTLGNVGAAAAGVVLPQVARAGHNLIDSRRRNRASESTSESNSSSSSTTSLGGSGRPILPEEEKLRQAAEQSSGSRARRGEAPSEESGVKNTTPGETGALDDVITDTEQVGETTTQKKTTESEEETTTQTERKNQEKKLEQTQEQEKSSEKTEAGEAKDSDEDVINKLKAQLQMKGAVESITTMDVLKAHLKEAFDINNFYDISIDENGRVHYTKLKKGLIFGTTTMDPATGYMYKDKSNIASTQILDKLTGFTKEDKKLIKEVFTKSRKAIFGVPLATLGMMTIVAHPAIGAGLLYQGTSSTIKTLKEFKPVSRFGRYTLKNFASPVLKASKYAELGRKNREKAEQLLKQKQDKTLKRHPQFVVNLKQNLLKPRTIAHIGAGALGAVTFGVPGAIIAGAATASVIHSMNQVDRVGYIPSDDSDIRNRYNPYNLMEPVKLYEAQNSSMWGKIEKHHYTQLKNKIAECEQEVFEDIDKATSGQIYDKTQSILEKSISEIEEKQEVAKWLELGYIYDPKTKQFTKIRKDDESDIKAKDLVKNIPQESTDSSAVQAHGRPMTQVDIAKINREMENIIVDMSKGSQVDLNDEKAMDYVVVELSARLEKANILTKGQSAEVLFKDKEHIKTAIKKKGELVNSEITNATIKQLDLSQDETTAISNAVSSAVNEEIRNAASPASEIKVEDMSVDQIYSSVVGVLQAKSTPQPVETKKTETKKKENKGSSTGGDAPKPEEPVAPISPEKEEIYKQAIQIMLKNKTEQVNQINVETSKPIEIRRSSRVQSGRPKVKDTISQLVMQSMESEPVVPTESEKQEVATKVKKASKSDISKKLKQIKEIDFDAIDGKLEEARSEEDNLKIQLLLVKKELSQKAAAINEAAEETLGRKVKRKTKTNSLTLDAIRERSQETTKYNELRKQKLDYELRHRIVTDLDTSHLTEKRQKEYDALKAQVDAQRTKMQEAEIKVIKRQKENGPITDAHKTFNNGLNDFLKRYGD